MKRRYGLINAFMHYSAKTRLAASQTFGGEDFGRMSQSSIERMSITPKEWYQKPEPVRKHCYSRVLGVAPRVLFTTTQNKTRNMILNVMTWACCVLTM